MPRTRAALALPLALVALLALLPASSACHSSKSSPIHSDTSATAPADAAGLSPADASTPPLPDALAASSTALGLDVYAAARGGHSNLALSPLSISMALTMAWAGARGDTAAQMKSVLHAQGTAASPEGALDAEAQVAAWVRSPARAVTLRVANRLFGEKSYVFQQPFLDRTSAAFGAALEPVDFALQPDASRRHVNDWVAAQTEQRINDLIPPSGVTKDTRLVLANAIYFLGHWEHAFKPEETRPAPFHVSAASTKDVPTMHEVERLLFAHAGGVNVLQVPYAGGELAMTFVLPDAIDGLEAVESQLSPATLTAWLSPLASARVRVALPSFTVNPPDALELGKILGALGMPLAFDSTKADFTGIADPPRPEDRLFLSHVFHKAFVKVDEQGTEAAAATAVTMRRPSAVFHEPPPEEFTADHPFLFFLRETSSGTLLFMGRVGDPSARS